MITRHSNNGSSPDSESEGKGSIPLWRSMDLHILNLQEDQDRLEWFLQTFGNTREGIEN